ncbi:MAG: hypothetical protein RTU63_06400 [Candidatus Thorarchaeota archaeon]
MGGVFLIRKSFSFPFPITEESKQSKEMMAMKEAELETSDEEL